MMQSLADCMVNLKSFSADRLSVFQVGEIVYSRCACKRGVVVDLCPRFGVIVQWEGHHEPYGCIPESLAAICRQMEEVEDVAA